MKRILTIVLVSFAFTSCGITSSLYYWGGMQNGTTTYENLAYKKYDKHGKGTGALRAGVHNYLRRQKHVKSFRLGAFGEGDAGVTIVEFK